jgi:hypothetical protein
VRQVYIVYIAIYRVAHQIQSIPSPLPFLPTPTETNAMAIPRSLQLNLGLFFRVWQMKVDQITMVHLGRQQGILVSKSRVNADIKKLLPVCVLIVLYFLCSGCGVSDYEMDITAELRLSRSSPGNVSVVSQANRVVYGPGISAFQHFSEGRFLVCSVDFIVGNEDAAVEYVIIKPTNSLRPTVLEFKTRKELIEQLIRDYGVSEIELSQVH